jgi:hypothetical protein
MADKGVLIDERRYWIPDIHNGKVIPLPERRRMEAVIRERDLDGDDLMQYIAEELKKLDG